MTHPLSIKSLHQQINRLDEFSETALNQLLERLGKQKSKLSLEDQSIIDWGISLVQAKIADEEKLMQDIEKDWQDITLSISNKEKLMENPGWDTIQNIDELEELGWGKFVGIIVLASAEGHMRKSFNGIVTTLVNSLFDVYSDKGWEKKFSSSLDNFIVTCDDGTTQEYMKLKGLLLKEKSKMSSSGIRNF